MARKSNVFSISGLIFPQHGDKLSADSIPQPAEFGFQAHSNRISAKEHVNPPSFSVTLLLLGEIPAHGSTVSSCLRVLLGVSLRPSSGLLEEPTCSRMGSVRLFCARMSCREPDIQPALNLVVASCVGMLFPPRPPMLTSICPDSHHLSHSRNLFVWQGRIYRGIHLEKSIIYSWSETVSAFCNSYVELIMCFTRRRYIKNK